MMLTLSVIGMFSCLYPVCLVFRILKNTYFKEQLSVVVSKYRNLHYDHGPNGKGIMASMEYILIIYSPNGKDMDLWNIFSPSGNRHGKN